MAKPRGFEAYVKALKGEKKTSKEDSDWLEKIAMANEELRQDGRTDSADGRIGGADGRIDGANGRAGGASTQARTGTAPPSPPPRDIPQGSFLKVPRTNAAAAKNAAAKDAAAAAGAQKADSKYRRVAKFLVLIGAEQAASILANLEPEQVEQISREITTIRGITRDEAEEILAEFQALLEGGNGAAGGIAGGGLAPFDAAGGGGAPFGGIDAARRLLYTAFGAEKGEQFLKTAIAAAQKGLRETSFDFLEDFTGEQIALLLRDEQPAAGAMILSRIAPKSAAAALSHADGGWRLEVARRIGRIGQVSPEVLEKTAAALREKARQISSGADASTVDGLGALASILKQSDISFGDAILAELADADPELGRELKERLYTLEDVVKADNKPLRIKLHGMSAKEIAVLIKGREEAFAEKILANISSNRKIEVREELDFMGPLSKKDSDAALKLFMNWFREGREEGAILMLGDDIVE